MYVRQSHAERDLAALGFTRGGRPCRWLSRDRRPLRSFGESPIADGGTPVEEWTGWDHDFACLSLDDCPGLTVIAPHPDDETLGLGATIATLCAAGVDVQVVSVSDGGRPIRDSDRARVEARKRCAGRSFADRCGCWVPAIRSTRICPMASCRSTNLD